VWATLCGLGGYFLGDSIHRFKGPVGITTFVLAALISIAFLVFVQRNERRLEAAAERALPGPLDAYRPEEHAGKAARQHDRLRVTSQPKTAPARPAECKQNAITCKLEDQAQPQKANTRERELVHEG
jgi:hypothetical protein